MSNPPIGVQIRRFRLARGWSLAELARRAGTSAPSLHRYENGWDNFELRTLRKIAAAMGARLEVRFCGPSLSLSPDAAKAHKTTPRERRISRKTLTRLLRPLFWDKDLTAGSLDEHPDWVLGRALTSGNRAQVEAVRRFYGDAAISRAIARRGVDARTRNYWQLILQRDRSAS